MNEWIEALRARMADLAPRERLLVTAAGASVALALLWLAVIAPIRAQVSRAHARIERAEAQLELARRLAVRLGQVEARLAQVEARVRGEPGNLFTALESFARQSAVKVDSMEPQAALSNDRYQETKVKVVLKRVTLAQLVSYLHRIESSPSLLSVKSLRVRTRPEKGGLLDVTFTVSSFEPRRGGAGAT